MSVCCTMCCVGLNRLFSYFFKGNGYRCLAIFFLIGIISESINAEEALVPALTPILTAKTGSSFMTAEKLLQIEPFDLNNNPMVKWIDAKRFIYRFPSLAQKNSQITLYNIELRQSEFITDGESPVPSPDGKWVAFVKNDGQSKQLWIVNTHNKKMKKISQVTGGLTGYYQYNYEYTWSPDSKKIIFNHQDYVDYWKNNKPRPFSYIELVDISTGESKTITSIDASVVYVSWLPASNEIIFIKERIGAYYHESVDREWIEALNVDNGTTRILKMFDGLQQVLNPIPSNDGKAIAITYDVDNPSFSFMLSLGIIASDANSQEKSVPVKQITHDLQLRQLHWSANNQFMFALRSYGPYAQLYKINLISGHPTQLTNEPINITAYDVSADGQHIAWIGEDAHGSSVLKLSLANASQTQDLLIQHSAPKDTALSEVREIEWETVDYPVAMRGLLVLPIHYQQGKQYPLIVDIHGGDVGATLNRMLAGGLLCTTPLEWQMWAAKEYAVFIPEFRSSAAFGSLAITRDYLQNHDRLGGDLKDIEAGVTYLIDNGIADPNRLAIFGHSAGGLRANWFEVSSHRYKTIVSHEGWSDELEDALNSLPSQRVYDSHGGSPQEVPENYLKNSPSHFVEHASTPILFLMGNSQLGGADPFKSVAKFHDAIKNKGLETDYIEYPDEGHLFDKLENKKDVLDRVIKWMDAFLFTKISRIKI